MTKRDSVLVGACTEWRYQERLMRGDFQVEARLPRRSLLAIDALPPIHEGPFDRLLITRATIEGSPLLTNDATIAQHPGTASLA